VPAFFLYGEPLEPPDERTIHVESIAARSSLHNWHIRPHRHRDLNQILLVQRGRAAVALDGRADGLRSPLAIGVPPGVVHSFRFQPDTVGLVISFADALTRELGRATPGLADALARPFAMTMYRNVVEATDLWPLAGMLLSEFTNSAPGRQTALRGLLAALLANLQRVVQASATQACAGDGGVAARPERELVARFREAVERNYREHLGVTEYAARLAISEVRLRRACVSACGQSPGEIVHQRLLIEAERQLRYTAMPIAQVAYYLGFEDPGYFARFFTRRMRVSPRAFRTACGAEVG
jgi:AraC family transcriptional activator of pobA